MFASNTSAANGAATYIEDVFSTYLYTGDDTNSRVITNGIDLAGKGGMVITAPRNPGNLWSVADTARGASNWLYTQSTGAQQTGTDRYGSFNSTGYTMGSSAANGYMNYGGYTYASWTFREQPKFFDVVTFTIDGASSNQQVAHSLGSTPGCILVKASNAAGDWFVYHNATGNNKVLFLNGTQAASTETGAWSASSTNFGIKSSALFTGALTGKTAVAYLFAHNAGGFGLTGTDNVISCGSFTTDGSGNATVSLGYEPQWVLVKPSSAVGNWFIFDNMRGFPVNSTGAGVAELKPNSSDAEATAQHNISPTATGFAISGGGGFGVNTTCIYIAIRRGPMKTPTSGTSVFGLSARSGTGTNATVTGGAGVTDLAIIKNRGAATNWVWASRLTSTGYLSSNATTAETAAGTTILQANPWDVMDGVKVGTTSNLTNASGNTFANYLLDRAPGFMDVVCYTGTGGLNQTINHNLGVLPELAIFKSRTYAYDWPVKYAGTWGTNTAQILDYPNASTTNVNYGATATSTTITLNTGGSQNNEWNRSGAQQVAYLFASCPGVSKVGSYTGTGTTQQINCGFTAGARFVLIKRTDSTGDWYVWDSARGIVAGNDPYLLLNSTAAEVTSTDYIDTYSAGFEISSTAPAAINASGGTFIYLAIA